MFGKWNELEILAKNIPKNKAFICNSYFLHPGVSGSNSRRKGPGGVLQDEYTLMLKIVRECGCLNLYIPCENRTLLYNYRNEDELTKILI